MVQAIDVSNAQPQDLTALIRKAGASHVVVKLYQTVEVAGGRAHAVAQIASALANGCTAGGYVWLYASVPVRQQIADALSLAAEAGIALPILWIDVEAYVDGSLPSAAQVKVALDECGDRGQRGGIYTGQYVWARYPGLQLPGVALWSASYNGRADLEVPVYGGMQIRGHQWTDHAPDGTGLDRSVFDPTVV